MNNTARLFLVLGSLNLTLVVLLGAFGAHALKTQLSEAMMQAYQTGVQYHFYHALGLLVLGILAIQMPGSGLLRLSGLLVFAGIVLFSGSLYLLALSGVKWLGMITPLGGTAFISGWGLLVAAVMKY